MNDVVDDSSLTTNKALFFLSVDGIEAGRNYSSNKSDESQFYRQGSVFSSNKNCTHYLKSIKFYVSHLQSLQLFSMWSPTISMQLRYKLLPKSVHGALWLMDVLKLRTN